MVLKLIVLFGSFVMMEAVAWFSHKYIMHGILWNLHKSHHEPGKGLEKNDLFGLFFASISFILIMVGIDDSNYMFWSGLGISLYGIAYFIFHDIIVHRRIAFPIKIKSSYLNKITRAHKIHHKTNGKYGGKYFGFLFVKGDVMKSKLMVLAGLMFLLVSADSPTGTIKIEITNLKNDKGNVKLSLYNSPDGFPKEAEKAVKVAAIPIKDGKAYIEFPNMPYGEYAVILLHDENNNDKMDFHFYGPPKEGYAASNGAKGTFGPPDFEDARFPLDKNTVTVTMKLDY